MFVVLDPGQFSCNQGRPPMHRRKYDKKEQTKRRCLYTEKMNKMYQQNRDIRFTHTGDVEASSYVG
jgi:hypothetical protein